MDDKEDGEEEDDEDQNPWSITEAPQTSDRYGECLMPVTPAVDPDMSPQSGMRFGKALTWLTWSRAVFFLGWSNRI